VQRFLIPFLPLLAASLWLEGKQWSKQIAATAGIRRARAQRAFAAASGIALGALALGIAWNFAANQDRVEQRRASAERGALLAEKAPSL